MYNRIKLYIWGAILNFLAVFKKNKKQEAAILADMAMPATVAPIAPPAIETVRPSVCVGTVRDITAMLDAEAVELYGRSPYVK